MSRYPIPAGRHQTETKVRGSRFIATADWTPTVEAAEAFVAETRAAYPDATHNCPAFKVGYGNRIITYASDDGEPSGTAGRPMLAVLEKEDIGDIAVVVTRYFGGTKLGTGGLVRAYSGAVKALLAELPRGERIDRVPAELAIEYRHYEPLMRLLADLEVDVDERTFGHEALLRVQLPLDRLDVFKAAFSDVTHGTGRFHLEGPEKGPT